jgi:hypothetical protein
VENLMDEYNLVENMDGEAIHINIRNRETLEFAYILFPNESLDGRLIGNSDGLGNYFRSCDCVCPFQM